MGLIFDEEGGHIFRRVGGVCRFWKSGCAPARLSTRLHACWPLLDPAFFPEFVPGLRGLDAADGLDRRRLLARLRTKLGQAANSAIGEGERANLALRKAVTSGQIAHRFRPSARARLVS